MLGEPMPALPPRGTKVDKLRCPKCKKTIQECPPSQCTDPECPNKSKAERNP